MSLFRLKSSNMKRTGYSTYFRIRPYSNLPIHFFFLVVLILLTNSCELFYTPEYDTNQNYDKGFIILSVDKDGKESVVELFNATMDDNLLSYELQSYSDNQLILVNRETYQTGYIISTIEGKLDLSNAKRFSIQGDKISHFREQSGKWIFEEIISTIQFPNSNISLSSNEKSAIYQLRFQNGKLEAKKTFTLESKFRSDSVLITYQFKENCSLEENAFYFTEKTHRIINNGINSGFNAIQILERDLLVYFDPKEPENPILIPYNELVSGYAKLHFVNKDYVIIEETSSGTLFKAKRIDDGYIVSNIGKNNRFLGVFDGIMINNYTLFNIYTNTENPISTNYFFHDTYDSKGYNLGKFIFFVEHNLYYSTRIGKINKETFEISDTHHFTIQKKIDIKLYDDILEPVTLTNGTSHLLIGESQRRFNVHY